MVTWGASASSGGASLVVELEDDATGKRWFSELDSKCMCILFDVDFD